MYRERKYILLFTSFILLLGFGFAGYVNGTVKDADSSLNNNIASNTVVLDNNNWNDYQPRVGETLEYDVWVRSIHGGKQTVRILGQESLPDRNILKVQYQLKTIGLAWQFTRYWAKEDIALDSTGFYPLSIRQEIHQGKTVSVEENGFNYDKGTFYRTFTVDGVIKESYERKLSGIVQDSVSLQLFLRKGGYQKGTNRLLYYESGVVEEVEYEVSEINEALVLKAGTFNGYYQVDYNKGKIVILLSKETHIPLVIRIMSPYMGKIEAKLIKIH